MFEQVVPSLLLFTFGTCPVSPEVSPEQNPVLSQDQTSEVPLELSSYVQQFLPENSTLDSGIVELFDFITGYAGIMEDLIKNGFNLAENSNLEFEDSNSELENKEEIVDTNENRSSDIALDLSYNNSNIKGNVDAYGDTLS